MIELFECERVGFQNFHQNYLVRSSILNSWNFSDTFRLTVGTFNLNLEGRTVIGKKLFKKISMLVHTFGRFCEYIRNFDVALTT